MEIPTYVKALIRTLGIVKLAGATFAAAETPPATPGPKPGTLAAYASTITLDRDRDHGDLTITTANLTELGRDGALTVAAVSNEEPGEVDLATEVDPKIRQRWRSKVLAQAKVISRLDARRSAVEAEIDRIARGRLDSGALDRLAKAEAKLRAVETEIRREKAALSRIVREARRQGAQPGWFR